MDKHICPVCSKEFEKKVYKTTQAVYCSPTCAYKGRGLGITKRTIFRPYNCYRKPLKTCAICQEEFVYSKKSQKYCSRKCFEISHKKAMSGSNGSSFLKPGWRGNDWETVRLEVYKRDKFVCQDCGVKCISKRDYKQNTSRIIQCHHIKNYDGRNNTKDNLVTLCLSCHLKRHNKI